MKREIYWIEAKFYSRFKENNYKPKAWEYWEYWKGYSSRESMEMAFSQLQYKSVWQFRMCSIEGEATFSEPSKLEEYEFPENKEDYDGFS